MRAQTTFKVAVAISLISLAVLVSSRRFFRKPTSSERNNHAANGLEVHLSPTTFLVEERRQFQMKAAADIQPECGTIDAKVPELRWEHSFTRSELMGGVQAELSPSQVGTFRMQFFCNGQMLGESGLSVTIGAELGNQTARNTGWVLTAKSRFTARTPSLKSRWAIKTLAMSSTICPAITAAVLYPPNRIDKPRPMTTLT